MQINRRGVSVADLQAFCAGAVHVGMFIDQLVPFVLIRIEGFYEWSDLPSSVSLLEPGQWQLGDWRGMPTSLALALVDADTGIVLGKRTVMYSDHVSKVFHDALNTQLEHRFDKELIEAVQARVYRKYRNSAEMVRAAQVMHRATRCAD
ncbi:hypothetical protein [Noviherbaspirillum pedocola]|uniref:Uncharacterized protein n=1 Tax=Noviherbaspirillum pedocola TaxID=2801341 RepID=A0A934W7U5_9BURK|nr:hypothetical protein [Noviherbaspirillum pedocola]MBK4737847.1 hypothetical protein [Noviherbaspirillum pedocola]